MSRPAGGSWGNAQLLGRAFQARRNSFASFTREVLIMETVLFTFLLDLPRAAAIWLVLIVIAMLPIAGLIARPGRETPAQRLRLLEPAPRRTRPGTQFDELSRYAHEVAVAADRAACTARRRREEWLAAQVRAEASWQMFTTAHDAARRLAAAAVLPLPRTPQTPAEYADRERYLHRAAMAACSRSQLSILDLSDALAHRNGWDPRRHPVEQEMILRRAVRDGLLAAHRTAADQERSAWRTAEVATAAARSLRDEAFMAALRARQAEPRPARVRSRVRLAFAGLHQVSRPLGGARRVPAESAV
jgi:hypothetical protein